MIICKCVRCGHEWCSRKLTSPARCAGCGALYWDRSARVPVIKPPKGEQGRPRKYPCHLLNVGQVMTLPMEILTNVLSCKQSIEAYGKRTGRRFAVVRVGEALKVRRTL